MTAPVDELREATAAEARLLATLDGMTDDEIAAPSGLPDWSRAELLTHVARNADSFRGMAEAAMRDEPAVQYPGGAEQREAGIADGRGRPAGEVTADVAQSIEWLHETWAAVPDHAWDHPGQTASRQVRLWETVPARWREGAVHPGDRDRGYTPADWPEPFVRWWLPSTVTSMHDRATAPVIDGRFVIWAHDLELAWVVTAETVTSFSVDDAQADVIVRGPGAQLLAWLYGRNHEPLTITGDRATAEAIPSRFPMP